ncbi:MAG: aminoacyl-tRNA hydrolase [Termitinemataceae bacterium]
MIELVAFLGNHGRQYTNNRHNAGWLLADQFKPLTCAQWQKKFKGLYAQVPYSVILNCNGSLGSAVSSYNQGSDGISQAPPERMHFLLPETYMNLSGTAVQEAAAFFKIPPERILVVHDELELPLGYASCKFSGGLGGHNGLRSIKTCLGTADFWRLRIGIGRPDHADIASYVLSDFRADEVPVLEQVLQKTSDALGRALVLGPESLLPSWNKIKLV